MKNLLRFLVFSAVLLAEHSYSAEQKKNSFVLWPEGFNFASMDASGLSGYDLVQRGSANGQEVVTQSTECIRNPNDPNTGVLNFRTMVSNPSTGIKKYELVMSSIVPIIDVADHVYTEQPSLQLSCNFSMGQGVAIDTGTRYVVMGMMLAPVVQPYDPNWVMPSPKIKVWNADTGVVVFSKEIPLRDNDYELQTTWSSVGNYLSSNDVIRVIYAKGNDDGTVALRIKYYKLSNGNQVGTVVNMTLPNPYSIQNLAAP